MEKPSPARGRAPMPGRRLGRLLPFVLLVVIGLLLLREHVPAVDTWLQRHIAPERTAAAEACRQAALASASQPDYARVRRTGTVHETRNGFYVEDVEIGEMGEDGAEAVFMFSCYADAAGRLVNTRKTQAGR